MNTAASVKQRLIDYLASVDLSKLTMMELSGYACIVSQLQSMDHTESELWRLAGLGCSIFNGNSGKETN